MKIYTCKKCKKNTLTIKLNKYIFNETTGLRCQLNVENIWIVRILNGITFL